jgi:hypothetical protein
VTRAETAREVLAAVDRGEIPRGGPSEAAARGLLDQLPDSYWDRWSEGAADRIRHSVTPLEDGHE